MNIKHSIICLYMHCFRCKDFRFRQMVKLTNGSDEKGVFTFPHSPSFLSLPPRSPTLYLGCYAVVVPIA